MKSPFPGMDPYLEDHWGDVHARIIVAASVQLARQTPADLKVRIEEYIAVEDAETPWEQRRYMPDVRVVERGPGVIGTATAAVAEVGSALAEVEDTAIVPLDFDQPTQREIRILDGKNGGRVVTAIEMLSATNKTTGRLDYRRKQRDFLEAGINLVEIDLLRGGHWVVAPLPELVPEQYRGPYRICVVRATQPRQAEVYRAGFGVRLPRIAIPLRATDSDVYLDLQTLIDQAYEEAGYGDTDYRQEPIPPFLPDEQAWADKLLREAGRR